MVYTFHFRLSEKNEKFEGLGEKMRGKWRKGEREGGRGKGEKRKRGKVAERVGVNVGCIGEVLMRLMEVEEDK